MKPFYTHQTAPPPPLLPNSSEQLIVYLPNPSLHPPTPRHYPQPTSRPHQRSHHRRPIHPQPDPPPPLPPPHILIPVVRAPHTLQICRPPSHRRQPDPLGPPPHHMPARQPNQTRVRNIRRRRMPRKPVRHIRQADIAAVAVDPHRQQAVHGDMRAQRDGQAVSGQGDQANRWPGAARWGCAPAGEGGGGALGEHGRGGAAVAV